MSTRFWKKGIERLSWLAAAGVFALGTLVAPAVRAEDKPTVKVTPDEDGSQPADKNKTKKKNKNKPGEAETTQPTGDPGVAMKYGIQPGANPSGPTDPADKAAEKGAEKK